MERWNNCVAVVTGASSGIGEAVVKDLIKAGLRVVALARRQERLEENRKNLPKGDQHRFYGRQCNITNEAKVKATFEWIEKTLGGTDILVNNAGVSPDGFLVESDTKLLHEVMNTNVVGLIYCTQAAFKSMKARNFAGHIIHINSVGGHQVLSIDTKHGSNMYAASKFAVTAINETLRNEFRNLRTGIKTTSISPGLVRTEIRPKKVFDQIGNTLNSEDISQAIMFAISTPPHVQIHEMIVKHVGEEF